MPSVPLTNLIQNSEESHVEVAHHKLGLLKRYLMIVMAIIVMWTTVIAAVNYPIKKK
jgi:hypothetical protein